MEPCFITTPIYYVNDRPHIGHCYSTLVADAAARFHRLVRGPGEPGSPPSVFFLTGTDEHADKVVTSAAEHGLDPQAWADRNADAFRAAFAFIGAAHDDFLRTTEPRHKDRVPAYIEALVRSGDVYKGDYTGWYDPGQEEYVTETAAKERGYTSAVSGRPLVRRTESCYFFRLSAYQQELADHIDRCRAAGRPFVRPEARENEVLGRLRSGLQDVPISRPVTDDPATRWGIRMPGDPSHRVYVWIDALFNYLTAVDTPERRRLWPPAVQVIGKDILWFHAVIWPALLMALARATGSALPPGGALPACVHAHAWWVAEGRKMSKSLGNFIDLELLRGYADRFGLDGLRWYLLTQGPLAAQDADFSYAKFVEVYNADLANGVGNCTSRVAAMIGKYFDGAIPGRSAAPLPPGCADLRAASAAAVRNAVAALDRFDLVGALAEGPGLVRQVDALINQTEPFKLAKRLAAATGADRPDLAALLSTVLYQCAETLRVASLLFSPAMPGKMASLAKSWGFEQAGRPLAELAAWGGDHALKPGTRLLRADPLFMRADAALPPPGPISA